MTGRPNILFINTDQQTFDAISAHGNANLDTPGIDRLVRNGVSFMRAYCTDPVCAPARASWATGMYTSEAGTPFNRGSLHDHIPDIGQLLAANGYEAYHCGKWHVDGRDVSRGFRTLYFGERPIEAGGGELYDSASTHAVLDFLSSNERRGPFYLQVGYVNPHDICEYQHNFEEKLIPDLVAQSVLRAGELPPLPRSFVFDTRETLVHMVTRRDDECFIHWPILRKTREWSDLQWRSMIWHFYRFVEKVDRQIAIVLAALSASRFRENTIVIFSVDHGEAGGQHRMFQKSLLYEECIRVPFIVACLGEGSGLAKGTRDWRHLLSGVDIFATVCDYAGIRMPEGAHGSSVRPLAEGRMVPWRDYAYVEANYWGRAIITDQYKYITEYIPKEEEDFIPPGPDPAVLGREQLFDLKADPWETRSLAGTTGLEPVLRRLRERLRFHEGQLRRIALQPGRPRAMVTAWGARLRERWRKEDHS